jgi:hypothetical protein
MIGSFIAAFFPDKLNFAAENIGVRRRSTPCAPARTRRRFA